MIFKNNALDLASDYDYFAIDLWGVVHDGTSPYPNALLHLQNLRKLNKKICFLSNAPRRSFKAAEVLKKFGITSDLYDFIMTSGEATYLFLEENQNNNFKLFGRNYFYIGPEKDADLLQGLNYQATSADRASFIINTGFDNDFSKLEEKLPYLKEAIKFDLPMICVNPDLMVIKQTGLEIPCAGVLAEEYKKMNGKVIYFGKPHKLIYEQVFRLFSLKNKNKLLAIGDGIETDILGASNNEIDSALIAGGILSNRLQIKYGELPSKEKIEKICDQYQIYPKFVIGSL